MLPQDRSTLNASSTFWKVHARSSTNAVYENASWTVGSRMRSAQARTCCLASRNKLVTSMLVATGREDANAKSIRTIAPRTKNSDATGRELAAFSLHSHGHSRLRVYAAGGAVEVGIRWRVDIARAVPSDFFAVSSMETNYLNAFSSMQQIVALIAAPRLLHHGAAEHSIVGGSSLGAIFAFYMANQLEISLGGARAAFTIDERRIPPYSSLGFDVGASRLFFRSSCNLAFAEVQKLRFRCSCAHFACPLLERWEFEIFQSDDDVNARRVIYMMQGDVYYFPGTTHMAIGQHHYWDIARRLRVYNSTIASVLDCNF